MKIRTSMIAAGTLVWLLIGVHTRTVYAKESKSQFFVQKIPIYAVIKPARMTTPLGVNHGMIEKIHHQIGDSVRRGQPLISVIERETTRVYRSSLTGQVAKIHINPGAVISPGMPLITVVDAEAKKVEAHLSPQEARSIQIGNKVEWLKSGKNFGQISKISPIVDTDTGAVTSYIKVEKPFDNLIGDVIALNIHSQKIKDCKVVQLGDVDQFIQKFKVEAISGTQACLKPKTPSPE